MKSSVVKEVIRNDPLKRSNIVFILLAFDFFC